MENRLEKRRTGIPAQLEAADYPIIVHNHYTTITTGNGSIVNAGRDMTANAGSAALLETIKAQAATISQMLNTIETQAKEIERLKAAKE